MANRFPLIVNNITKKIEELVAGDNIDLTGNGLLANNSLGTNGQYLKTNGTTIVWDNPGDVYLTASQTLTNKTLTSPILITPSLGVATATSINGLSVSPVTTAILSIANTKTVSISNTLSFSGIDSSTINFGSGGTVLYDGSINFSNFSSTTSAELRTKITDETGTGLLVFNSSPSFSTSINTSSSTFDLLNTTVATINAFGAANDITIGSSNTGSTTIRHSISVSKDATFNTSSTDIFTVNGTANFVNADISIRGSSSNPIKIGRGGGAIVTNTRIGYLALENNISGTKTVAIGYEAGLNSNGNDNTAVGHQSLITATSGSDNTAVGSESGKNTVGSKNTSVGSGSLFSNGGGDSNVCIGHYAGYGILSGTGNVIIGPADNETTTDATYRPPSEDGNRQLVIGSGPGAWIRGDSNYDVTIPNDLTVGTDLTVTGNLLVNGTTVTVNATTLTIDDKNIELGSVNSPTDSLANGGGIILKGTSDKTLTYVLAGSITSWTSSENFNLLSGKAYRINDVDLITSTRIGPTTGTLSLGAGVTTSSLTTVSTLAQNLTISGSTTSGGSLILQETDVNSPTEKSITHKVSGGNDFSSIIMRRSAADEGELVFKLRSGSATYNESIKFDKDGNLVPLLTTNTIGTSTNNFSNIHSTNLTVDTSTLVVDGTNNRVGFGTSSPQEFLHHNVGNTNAIIRYQRTSGITNTINLARFSFWDNTTETSYIQASRDGAGGAGKIAIWTKDTTGTLLENIRFDASGNSTILNGNLILGTNGKGIDFSSTPNPSITGTTVISETLDDYEEGTWVPEDSFFELVSLSKQSDGSNYPTSETIGATTTAITGSGFGLTVTWSSVGLNDSPQNVRVKNPGTGYQEGDIIEIDDATGSGALWVVSFPQGSYTKIGDMVYATFDITYTGVSGTNSGESVLLSGLPYGAKSGKPESWGGFITFAEYNGAEIKMNIIPGSTTFKMTITGGSDLVYSNISQLRLAGTLIYKT